MKIEILCKVFQHGNIYAKKGDIVLVPDSVGEAICKAQKAQEVPDEPKAKKRLPFPPPPRTPSHHAAIQTIQADA